MADQNNPGQFGNREDTEEQASIAGQMSSGQFGSDEGADPSEAGKKGAKAQSKKGKKEGGEHSHEGRR